MTSKSFHSAKKLRVARWSLAAIVVSFAFYVSQNIGTCLSWLGANLATLVFLTSLIVAVGATAGGILQLAFLIQNSVAIRRVGKVSICISNEVNVPFCHSFLNRSWIVVSEEFAGTSHFEWAVRHELCHLRNRDTAWNMTLTSFRAFFFWFPLAKVLVDSVSDLQELVCDENVLKSHKAARWQYTEALEFAAQISVHKEYGFAPMMLGDRVSLHQRIGHILDAKKHTKAWGWRSVCASVAIMSTSATLASAMTQPEFVKPFVRLPSSLSFTLERPWRAQPQMCVAKFHPLENFR